MPTSDKAVNILVLNKLTVVEVAALRRLEAVLNREFSGVMLDVDAHDRIQTLCDATVQALAVAGELWTFDRLIVTVDGGHTTITPYRGASRKDGV